MGSCASKPQDGTTAAPKRLPVLLLGRCGDVVAQLPKLFQHSMDRKWERLVVPPPDEINLHKWKKIRGEEVERLLEHVDLVDLKYVVELVEAGRPIPRWQDVPCGARIGRHDVHRIQLCCLGRNELAVLVLSYPWLDAGHPDKQLRTMRRLLPCLKAFLGRVRGFGDERCTVGLMMDYMCLPQKRPDGTDDRTVEDKARFKQGLSTINQWYAHPNTTVLIFDVDMPDQSSGHSNLRSHSARGWCVFELRASSFIKSSDCLWSLRTYEAGGSKLEFDDAKADATSTAGRLAPQGPDEFAATLREGVNDGRLAFTAKADLDVVIDQYGKAFDAAFTSTEFLTFCRLGWCDAEVAALARAVTAARERNPVLTCMLVELSDNQCTEVGLLSLLEALKGMDCDGEDGMIIARGNNVSEAGRAALEKAAEGAGVEIVLD